MNHFPQTGFTMFELMITIAIIAVLVAVATPNFTNSLKNNRLTSKTNDLVIALNIARQTAVGRSQTTFVCHSNNADTNTPTCNGGTNSGWNTGLIVYAAGANTLITGQRSYVPATDDLIQQIDLVDDDQITVIDENANAATFVSFGADGLLFGTTAVQFQICDDRTAETGRLIRVTAAGKISSDIADGASACT